MASLGCDQRQTDATGVDLRSSPGGEHPTYPLQTGSQASQRLDRRRGDLVVAVLG